MADEKKQSKLSPKQKKIINIVVDVVVAVILVFAVILAVCTIRSRAKGYDGYTEFFGKAYISVLSESMDAEKPEGTPEDKPEGFAKDDLIAIKLLSEDEAKELEVGDIITFKTTLKHEDKQILNTHRIIGINRDANNNPTSYVTRGDNNPGPDESPVLFGNIVGIYTGKAGGIGKVITFMGTSTGFFVCIVLPTLLIVVYCVFNLIIVIKKEKKVQDAEAADEKAQERERIRAELLAEMNAQGGEANEAAPEKAEAEPVVVAEPVAEPVAEEHASADVEPVAEEPAPEVVAEEPAEVEKAEESASTPEAVAEEVKEEKAESPKKPAAKKTASTAAKKPAASGAKKPASSTAKKTTAKKEDSSKK